MSATLTPVHTGRQQQCRVGASGKSSVSPENHLEFAGNELRARTCSRSNEFRVKWRAS